MIDIEVRNYIDPVGRAYDQCIVGEQKLAVYEPWLESNIAYVEPRAKNGTIRKQNWERSGSKIVRR